MKLIAGLGNPGFRYRNTRHNAGFLVIKEISGKLRTPLKQRKYDGLISKGSFQGEDVTLFMPETYMNLSGGALYQVIRKSRVSLNDVLVICDDTNLDYGGLRLREKGSSGGHNGIESIISALGTDGFSRLRIGVGAPERPGELAKFVLEPFSREERPLLKGIIKEASECALVWLTEGPNRAMARFNRRQFP